MVTSSSSACVNSEGNALCLCFSRLNSDISRVSQDQQAAVLQPAHPTHAGKMLADCHRSGKHNNDCGSVHGYQLSA